MFVNDLNHAADKSNSKKRLSADIRWIQRVNPLKTNKWNQAINSPRDKFSAFATCYGFNSFTDYFHAEDRPN